jgi:cyclophilin family peptidyl-prolyl cis-trans isomerase
LLNPKLKIMRKFVIASLSLFVFISGNIIAQNENDKTLTRILIQTDFGSMTLVLYEGTPLHKENFTKLVKEGYLDGLLFHRLIKDFMIQGGDPNSKNASKDVQLGQGGPGYTIPAEINPNYFHKRGALAAARKGDAVNPSKASSGSQFYIVQGTKFTKPQLDNLVILKKHLPFTKEETEAYTTTGGSPHLDGAYTVFGEMVDGFDILEKLMNVPVDANNRPLTDIKFTVKILE